MQGHHKQEVYQSTQDKEVNERMVALEMLMMEEFSPYVLTAYLTKTHTQMLIINNPRFQTDQAGHC